MNMNIVQQYIDFLYENLPREEIEKIFSIPPGVTVLRNDGIYNIFEHPHVKLWHRFLIERFRPEKRRYCLLLPCTSIKPYRLSATHRVAEARLEALGISTETSVYVVSEPMALVPRELDVYYPFANYEYPPEELTYVYRRKLVKIISQVLKKIVEAHRRIVAVLPRHHLSIVMEAASIANTIDKMEFVPYGRLAFRSIAIAIDKLVDRT